MTRMMIVLCATFFLGSCGDGEVTSRYEAIKAGIQQQCSWLPTAASMTKLVNTTIGVPVETVVKLVCAEVNKLAFNTNTKITLVQDGKEETVCIEVDGKLVCIEGEKTNE